MNKPPFHSKNLRKYRQSTPGHYYHLVISTHNKQAVFQNYRYATFAAKSLYHYQKKYAETLAFTVMPDHIHWLIELKNSDLSAVVKYFKSAVTKCIHTANNDGEKTIWQPGYYDQWIREEKHLENTARYIVANPIRAKLVDKIGNYPYWWAVYLDQ